jgi:hypothetical protein
MMNDNYVNPDALKEIDQTNKEASESTEKKNTLTIERARLILNTEQHLYSALLQNCRQAISTAGVRISGTGQVELSINQKFWDSLEGYQGVGLLMHEMLHILYEHLTWGKLLDQRIANFAMDITINQFIPKHWLPRGALLPEMKYPDKIKVQVSGGENAEFVELDHPKAGQHIWNFESGKNFLVYYSALIKLRDERRKEQKEKNEKKNQQKGKKTPLTEEQKQQRKEEQKKKQEEKKKQQEEIKEIIAKQKEIEEEKMKCLQAKKQALGAGSLSATDLKSLKLDQSKEVVKQTAILKSQSEINSLLEKVKMMEPRVLSELVKASQAKVQSEMEKLYE